MSVEIKVLKALQGDCIWIRYGEDNYTNIIVDSGPEEFKDEFKDLVLKIQQNGESIDLLIFTHIDNDHIGGACAVLSDYDIDCKCIKKIWINTASEIYNYFNLKLNNDIDNSLNIASDNQVYTPEVANQLIDILIKRKIEVEQLIMVKDDNNIEFNGATITILSPTKKELINLVTKWEEYGINTEFSSESWDEVDIDTINEKDKYTYDSNKYNGSSIAFIFKYMDISIALLGDAYPNVIANTIKEYLKCDTLDIDLIKISHHGSASNTNSKLLKKFNCKNYVISTDGTNDNPDKRTIARLIKANDSNSINLYSNYNWWEDRNCITEMDYKKYVQTGILNRIELSSEMILIKEGLLISNE